MAFDLGAALKDVSKLDTGREQIEYIRLEQIEEDPNNFYQLSDIDQLAANIELCGLQQPIRVRPIPDTDRYMIVSGHRRRKAIEALAQDDPEKWSEVSCIVERDSASPALQQLRLIYANANTRKMTPAEISAQAEQVEKLLYQLKEEGYEFPGRMRDHVAEAVGASKSKLARLKVIRDGLSEAWKPSFQRGELNENVAYTLARMSFAHQNSIYAVHAFHAKSLSAESLEIYQERMRAIDAVVCKHNQTGTCVNAREMREKSCKDRWTNPCGSLCCYDCASLQTCGKSCRPAAEKKKELKQTAIAAERESQARIAERERSRIDLIRDVYLRVGEARNIAGKSVDDIFAAQKRFVTVSAAADFEELEQGTKKVTASTHLPFGCCFDASTAEVMIAVADCLGCSLDWLLGRTDVKELTSSEVIKPDAVGKESEFIPGAWYPVSVEPPVGERLILIDSEWFVDCGKYIGCGEYTMDYGAPVAYWTFEPKAGDVASSIAAASTSWRSSKPEAYGFYTAYVKIADAPKPMIYELLWDGEEWLHRGSPLIDDVSVACWIERPEL